MLALHLAAPFFRFAKAVPKQFREIKAEISRDLRLNRSKICPVVHGSSKTHRK
jgi:hypothetical protein